VTRSFSSVREFLESQRRGRPQTFEEIASRVGKSRPSCAAELRGLILVGVVNVLVLRFNGRDCAMYTVREDVVVRVVKGAGRF